MRMVLCAGFIHTENITLEFFIYPATNHGGSAVASHSFTFISLCGTKQSVIRITGSFDFKLADCLALFNEDMYPSVQECDATMLNTYSAAWFKKLLLYIKYYKLIAN